ncbi:uncharacterized protein TRIVIDRAFT_64727 [Trichoderma virens Gv29-8]|uniref:Uncharacterized protein n=1 Tax=Hypocrea virens (strain Gv29-8 / FGSC 10586) TaxID=413071 RepID=G9NCD7_HYPVG|nr:uncharacterized protein TRIVIDRAFT_64727 [Trichoderma virens Gv29-8]EHK15361.1 hypothetical protein TRIVIDRAFT_64727 [Trichoderma virens Gv29-8]
MYPRRKASRKSSDGCQAEKAKKDVTGDIRTEGQNSFVLAYKGCWDEAQRGAVIGRDTGGGESYRAGGVGALAGWMFACVSWDADVGLSLSTGAVLCVCRTLGAREAKKDATKTARTKEQKVKAPKRSKLLNRLSLSNSATSLNINLFVLTYKGCLSGMPDVGLVLREQRGNYVAVCIYMTKKDEM